MNPWPQLTLTDRAAGIFSVVVSGNGESKGLLDASDVGPDPAQRRRLRAGGQPVHGAGRGWC